VTSQGDPNPRPREALRTALAKVLGSFGAVLVPIPLCDLYGKGVVQRCLLVDPLGRIHGLCEGCAESASAD
jgi:hypothetical protein